MTAARSRLGFHAGTAFSASIAAAGAAGIAMAIQSSVMLLAAKALRAIAIEPVVGGVAIPDVSLAQMAAVATLGIPFFALGASFFVLPAMVVAYPFAALLARRRQRPWRLAGLGAALGPTIGLAAIAVAIMLDTPPAYRRPFARVFADAFVPYLLPAMAAGAAIGWMVATAYRRRSAIPAPLR